jgi:hypothetical protein
VNYVSRGSYVSNAVADKEYIVHSKLPAAGHVDTRTVKLSMSQCTAAWVLCNM